MTFDQTGFGDVYSAVFLILIAPAIGSSLGGLEDALPRQEDIFGQRSGCRACGAPLGFIDLIPILSFVMLGAKCRQCHKPIAGWHLYLEVAALGLALVALSSGGNLVLIWLTALFFWILLGLVAADLLWFRLPDPLTLALFVTALALAMLPGQMGVFLALAGAALGSGVFWIIRIAYKAVRGREGLGFGDVKLMAGLGAFCGPFDLALLLLLASAGALITGLVAYGVRGGSGPWATRRLPFGAALCIASLVLWIYRQGSPI